jgi:prolyl 4-hydroxylase
MGMGHAEQVVISPDGSIESLHASASSAFSSDTTSTTYGVDVSWPMQHPHVSTKERPLGDSIQETYADYIRGCQQQPNVKDGFCEMYESDRLEMNLLQPRSMENYTHAGFAKVKAPAPVMTLLQKFWNANHGSEVEEVWDKSNTYVNHWDVPTSMLDLGRSDLSEKSGMTDQQRWKLVQEVKAVLEQWTRQSLVFTSLYGIRIYHTGAILAPHVDRLPLVSSAIINVAQDDDDAEPWILEVIGHTGKAVNLTLDPGDMLLYESHSVIHGRPFPLQGNYYANVFFHFEPFGHTARHSQKNAYGSDDVAYEEHTKAAYEKALKREQQKQYDDDNNSNVQDQGETTSSPGLPPYIHLSEEVQWKQQFYFDREARVRTNDNMCSLCIPLKKLFPSTLLPWHDATFLSCCSLYLSAV